MKGLRGQGRIFKRGEKYWVAYYVDVDGKSKEQRESAGYTMADAKKLLKSRWIEIHSGKFVDPKKAKITVNDLLDNYLVHLKNQGGEVSFPVDFGFKTNSRNLWEPQSHQC